MPIDDDAAISASDIWVPFSEYASVEARDAFLEFRGSAAAGTRPDPATEDELAALILELRADADAVRRGIAERMVEEFSVSVAPAVLGGVEVDVIEPLGGLGPEARERVLINLHGGGMIFGARWEGHVMSIPVAARAGIKVVTVDYRMAPEHRFPAASEDVAAVYQALLEDYEPGAIGIYGCSAGGWLTSWSIAWFDAHGIPRPGAAGIISAGLTDQFGGDSSYLDRFLSGGRPVPRGTSPRAEPMGRAVNLYTASADRTDPLVDPTLSPDLLSRFPPTLLLNSGRDGLLSSTFHGHRELVKAGVEAELYVWEGLWHAFLYDSSLPESQEAYDVIASFFDRHLT